MINLKFGLAGLFAKLEAEAIALRMAEESARASVGAHLAKEMLRTIEENTESWEPLSDRTIAMKGHSRILIETGEMKDSIEWRKSGKNITIGVHSDAPNDRNLIALAHEYGVPENNMPARSFIMSTWEREKDNVGTLFSYNLKKGL
jgi:hypothetical protein